MPLDNSVTFEDLPYITPDLPGIGGRIKARAQDFTVEEIPAYEPVGQGDHVYVRLVRSGMNTRDVVRGLARLFRLKEVDVGCAGQKDKEGVITQTFSLRLPRIEEDRVATDIAAELPVTVQWAKRHQNKIKTGHLLGNAFEIRVTDLGDPDALTRAEAVTRALEERGLPNYYGSQRFGKDGDNAVRGRDLLSGQGPRDPWLKKFLLSAFQSALFNEWLSERIRRSWFDRILVGDIAKKTDTGGLFEVEDLEAEEPRFLERQITYTGPIYGHKTRPAHGIPGELEHEILGRHQVDEAMLKKAKLEGSRRPARIFVQGLSIVPEESGLLFRFPLPKGSYATTVLREFMKNEE